MAKAIVRLTHGNTQNARGRNFTKGKPQTITNSADIAYFRSQGWFSVQIIAEEAPTIVAPPKAPEKDVPPQSDEDDEEVEVEMLTQSQLDALTKRQLVTVGEDRLVLLTGQEKKAEMISQILEAQDQLAEQEDDDDDEEDNE